VPSGSREARCAAADPPWRGCRLDFTALQRRLHPSATHAEPEGALAPATLVVFDLLAVVREDLRGEAYRARRYRNASGWTVSTNVRGRL
jgi:ATP-dependent DNA ligase